MNVGGNARLRIKIKGCMYRHANEPFITLGGLKFTESPKWISKLHR